jgi:hypothetical protein
MLASKGEKELNENEKNWKIGKKTSPFSSNDLARVTSLPFF